MNKFTKNKVNVFECSKLLKIVLASVLIVLISNNILIAKSANKIQTISFAHQIKTKKVTINISQSSLESILVAIFKQSNVQYTIHNDFNLDANDTLSLYVKVVCV